MKNLLIICSLLCAVPAMAQEAGNELGNTFVLGDGFLIASQAATDDAPAALQVFGPGPEGWQLSNTLVVDGVLAGDGFGFAMDLEGHTVAVGAPFTGDSSGVILVYVHDSDTQTLELVDQISSDVPWGQLGYSLDLRGDMLIAGMPGNNSALVVRGIGTSNTTQTALGPDDAAEGDQFGAAVAADGDKIYVGAPRRNENAGGVYVFASSAEDYTQEAVLEVPDRQTFGRNLIVTGPGRLFTSAPGLSVAERRASGQRMMRIGRGAGSGPAFAISQTDDGWDISLIADSLRDFLLVRSGRIPMASDGDHVFIGLPQSTTVLQYGLDASTGQWQLVRSILGADVDASMGAAIAVESGTLAALAPAALYGLGAIVMFDGSDEGFVREGRLTLVADQELAQSGQVDCEDGTALHFDCSNVDMLAFLPISALAGQAGTELNDIWGWTDPETGVEYALVGRTDGTAFVELSDPSNPVLIGDLRLTEGARPSSWRDIKVFDNHAFVVADGSGAHGMQVFDLTQLRDVTTPPVTFSPTVTYDRIGSAHNVVINEDTGVAYIVGIGGSGETCGGGLHMVDITDPANLSFVGCFADTATGRRGTGYTHDAQCVIYNGPDAEHSGKEICFNANETALSIADVSDKDSTIALSNASYPGVRYAHQGWLTEDHRYYYMNDETDELGGAVDGTRTLIWDVTDLDDPQLLKEHISENRSSDHNLYIRDNLMYQSNYGSGLRIFDISDPVNMVEVGFFDTVTVVPDQPGFIGSWSNYPYFESGTIVITSINEGLFVLKKRDVDA